jgi:hypothetical protein
MPLPSHAKPVPDAHDRFSPDMGWLKCVSTLADRYGKAYGVFRDGAVYRLEYERAGKQYVYLVRPKQ